MTIAPMRVLPLLVLTLWGLSSCRKQSSEAFHQLDAQQSVLISREAKARRLLGGVGGGAAAAG